MSLNCLLQGLSFLQTVFGVVPHCFASFVVYQEVNGYHFALSIVMILLNQVWKIIYHILHNCSSNKSSKRDRYVLRFPKIYHMSHFYLFIYIQIWLEKIIKIAKIITKFLKSQQNRPVVEKVPKRIIFSKFLRKCCYYHIRMC